MRPHSTRMLLSPLVLALALLAGCEGGKDPAVNTIYTGGDAHRGAQLTYQFGCGACHIIPGVHNAKGLVGPPLGSFGRRTYIAGEVANQPDNLVRWLRSPKSIEPGTAMPDVGLNEQQARDVAAYLYTLRQ